MTDASACDNPSAARRQALLTALPLLRALGSLMSILLLSPVAGSAESIGPGDVSGPLRWGTADSVMHLENLYISGQPDRAGLEAARTHGVEVVIDLRDPSEREWDEGRAADELGLIYHNVPVSRRSSTFDPDVVSQIDAIVKNTEGRKSSSIAPPVIERPAGSRLISARVTVCRRTTRWRWHAARA